MDIQLDLDESVQFSEEATLANDWMEELVQKDPEKESRTAEATCSTYDSGRFGSRCLVLPMSSSDPCCCVKDV